MEILSDEILTEYKNKQLLYQVFHSFHPITEDQSLVYKKIQSNNNGQQAPVKKEQNTSTQPAAQQTVPKVHRVQKSQQQTQASPKVEQTEQPKPTESKPNTQVQQTQHVQNTQRPQPNVMPKLFEDAPSATDRTPQNPMVFNNSNTPNTNNTVASNTTVPNVLPNSNQNSSAENHAETLPNQVSKVIKQASAAQPAPQKEQYQETVPNATTVTPAPSTPPKYHRANSFNPVVAQNTQAKQSIPNANKTQTSQQQAPVQQTSSQPKYTAKVSQPVNKVKNTTVPNTQQTISVMPQRSQESQQNATQAPVSQVTQRTVENAQPSVPKQQVVQRSQQTQQQVAKQTIQPKKTLEQANSSAYEIITRAASQLEWIKKVNSFELAYKKQLKDMPIPALRVFDLNDSQELILPLNDGAILHDIYSITITKDLCLMLLFRNNSAISLAPETLFNNGANKDLLLKNGFSYFYKNYGLDINKLIQSFKMISVSSTTTPEFTQFILKTMPFMKN